MFRKVGGLLAIVGVIVSWVAQAQLARFIQVDDGVAFNKPYFIIYFNHSWLLLFFLGGVAWIYFKRPQCYVQTEEVPLVGSGDDEKHEDQCIVTVWGYLTFWGFPKRRLASTSLWLGFLYLVPNYGWYLGLPFTTVSQGTAIFNTSAAFVYVASIFLLNEALSVIKVLSVIVSIGGVAILAFSSSNNDDDNTDQQLVGNLIMLAAAATYGFWEVIYRRYAVQKQETPMAVVNVLMGGVGLSTCLLFWPGLIVLHITNVEVFVFPTRDVWPLLLFNAALGTMYNTCIMLALTLCPSALFVAVGVLLTMPVAMLTDWLLHGTTFPALALLGMALIAVGFGVLAAKEHVDSAKTVEQSPTPDEDIT